MSLALVHCAGKRSPSRKVEMSMTAEPWVSVDELARHLGVTKDSVYRWIEHRGLPAQKIGKLWKFKISEVDQWVRTGAGERIDLEFDEK